MNELSSKFTREFVVCRFEMHTGTLNTVTGYNRALFIPGMWPVELYCGKELLELHLFTDYEVQEGFSEYLAQIRKCDMWVERNPSEWETDHWGEWQSVGLERDFITTICHIYEQEEGE